MELLLRIDIPKGEIDLLRRVVAREGEERLLTGLEVDLLRYLAARPGMAVSRRELLDKVWGYGHGVRSRAVDNTVRRLRHKIEPDPSAPRLLCTVHGFGYRWDGPRAGPPAATPEAPVPASTQTLTARPSESGAQEDVVVLQVVVHPDAACVGARRAVPGEPIRLGRGGDALGVGVLSDGRISRQHLEVQRDGEEVVIRDVSSRNGTFVNGQRVHEAVLQPGDVLEIGNLTLLVHLEPRWHDVPRHPRLVGRSGRWSRVLGQVSRLAVSSVPVAVVGEVGTGRRTLGQELVRASGEVRSLAQGAFPRGRPGPWVWAGRADDVQEVAELVQIDVPPLRQRPDDILPLARHFAGAGVEISQPAALRLLRYGWPGNVAELQQTVTKATATAALSLDVLNAILQP